MSSMIFVYLSSSSLDTVKTKGVSEFQYLTLVYACQYLDRRVVFAGLICGGESGLDRDLRDVHTWSTHDDMLFGLSERKRATCVVNYVGNRRGKYVVTIWRRA